MMESIGKLKAKLTMLCKPFETHTDVSEQITFIEGEFQRLQVDKDDVIVLSYPGALSEAALACLQESFKKQFPGRKCLILENGMKLGVMHESNAV